jgi:hypothetical protein
MPCGPSCMGRSGSAILSWQAMSGSRRKTGQDSSLEYSKSIVRHELANVRRAADCLQCPLRSRFRQQLTPNVSQRRAQRWNRTMLEE